MTLRHGMQLVNPQGYLLFWVYERENETNGSQECRRRLFPANVDTCPEEFQDVDEGLDIVRCGGFGKSSNSQSNHNPDPLLFVRKAVRHTVDKIPKVRQDGTSRRNSGLLDDTNASVSSLP